MAANDLESAIERSHAALREIINGNPEVYEGLFSDGEDVTRGNPFGPFARGRQMVSETVTDAASRYREGEIIGFDPVAQYVTDDLACVVEVERFRAKVGGSNDLATIGLRVTSLFRPEDGSWRLVHRHADPITTSRSPESVIQK
jgi:ketosteroid isomerase-like protein